MVFVAAHLMVATAIKNCRLCGGDLRDVLSLGNQYLVRFPDKIDETLPRAPLNLVQCTQCDLLQLEHTTVPDLLFREFFYKSGINQSMRDALQDIVDDGLAHSKQGGVWLDIGANDGTLLSCLPENWERIACEPALNFAPQLEEMAQHVIADYFSADHECLTKMGRGRCDVITAAAMFYDLDDPNGFLKDINRALTPGGVFINQLNDSPTMIKQNAFDAVCHEHLVYYDLHNLAELYRRHGLVVTKISFNDTNGGSVRVFAHKEVAGLKPLPLRDVPRVQERDAELFAQRTARWKQEFGNYLRGLKHGAWAYGASTKGTALLQYLECNEMFVAVADRNPSKAGKMMVGSWLPITDEVTMRKARPEHAVVLPWGFRKEFIEREQTARESGTALVFPLPNIEVVL